MSIGDAIAFKKQHPGAVYVAGATELAVAFDELLEVDATDKFHDHEVLATDVAEVVGLDDVGVDQIGDEAGFTDEILLKLFEGGVFFANEFHRDDFSEIARAELDRFVNDAHPALCDFTSHLVMEFVEDVLDGGHGH